jgi:hypothetical protein
MLRRPAYFFARALTVLGFCSSAQAATGGPVNGNWIDPVSCVPTGYNLSTGQANCDGVDEWDGTWNGLAYYHETVSFDLITGDASGTAQSTFVGRSSDGRKGTLQLFERLRLDGATGNLHVDGYVTGGSGDFAGARGFVQFDGKANPATGGTGTYAGWWAVP